ncbi:MAG: radical SAM protein [Armatimonadia bacterium]|nr:radical SAM protein [Armatimonadia bacterium]
MQLFRRDVLDDETWVHGPPTGSGRLRVALLFPSEYAVGMANLAVQSLYGLLNAHGDVLCERVFYPDIPEQDRRREDTLRSLEHDTALGAFDVIAITSSFELDWLNVPAALEEGGVPVLADDRTRHAPMVIAGGPAVTANPQPLAPIADALFIGEAEPIVGPMLDLLLDHDLSRDAQRQAVLEGLASMTGFYVPAIQQDLPISRVALSNLDAVPTTTEVLSPHSEFPSAFLVETGRGCPRGCRFCLARQVYSPLRTRSAASILSSAREGLQFTERVGLVGAAVADHPQIEQIATEIVRAGGRVTTSSLRAEGITPQLLEALAAGGQRTITLAPETADPELAAAIGKNLDFETVLGAVELAADAGLTDVKLYFMLGIPGETDAVVARTAGFVEALEETVSGVHVTVAAGALVPKPHTEFERVNVPAPREVQRRLKRLRKELRARTRSDVRISSARWGAVQTAMGRGGRELAPVLIAAAGGGPGDFERALRDAGLSLEDYLSEQTGALPWDVVGDCVLQEARL